jgi:hypothetical protein
MERAAIVAASCGEDPAAAVKELLAHVPVQEIPQVGLIVGTTQGCVEADRAFDVSRRENPRYASPAAFATTLPSTVAARLALQFKLIGPSLVLSAGDASAAVALRRAVAWRRQLGLSWVIAGGIEQMADGMRVGLVLLGDGGGHGEVRVDEWSGVDLEAVEDRSLLELVRWVRDCGEVRMGAGVLLRTTSA